MKNPPAAGNPTRFLRPRVTLLLICAFLSAGYLPSATPAPDTGAQLQELRTHLKGLEKDLNTSRGERDNLREELRAAEQEIGAQLKTLKQLNIQLKSQATRLAGLRAEKDRQRQQIQVQVTHLEKEARAAYILGQQENLKLLLNQENPASVSRVLAYHHYLQQARATRIQEARVALARLAMLTDQIQVRTRELEALRSEELAKKQTLLGARAQRSRLLAQVNLRVRNQAQEMERVRLDEQRLVRLLQELKTVAIRTPPPSFPNLPGRFQAHKGKLPLPMQGRITARFGAPRSLGEGGLGPAKSGGLRWRGIFVTAPEGHTVASIFRGRVAYADWLRGFGLLIILEHGDGYMTLYGHNQSLYKEAGDWVEAGQTIAGSGSTGGPPEPGLYFEIRHNGEPRDPLEWCKIR